MRAHHAITLAVVLASASAFADDPAEEEGHEHHHSNHFALFTGATSGVSAVRDTRFTFGADYERRLDFVSHALGAGVLIDAAVGAGETETLIAGFLSFHPVGGLMVLAGAGETVTGVGSPLFAVRVG